MAPRMKIESAQPAAETGRSPKTAQAPSAKAPAAKAGAPTAKVDAAKAGAPTAKVDAPAQEAAAPAKGAAPRRPGAVRAVVTPAQDLPETPAPAPRRSSAKVVVSPTPAASDVRQDRVAAHPGAADSEPDRRAAEPRPQEAAPDARPRRGILGAPESVSSWVSRTFPGHEHAFWGAVLALVVALMVFAIGVWRVLFIALLVVVGVAVGQVLDGDPKIIAAIRELFSNDRGQE